MSRDYWVPAIARSARRGQHGPLQCVLDTGKPHFDPYEDVSRACTPITSLALKSTWQRIEHTWGLESRTGDIHIRSQLPYRNCMVSSHRISSSAIYILHTEKDRISVPSIKPMDRHELVTYCHRDTLPRVVFGRIQGRVEVDGVFFKDPPLGRQWK
jgi:hypothetical protein